MPPNPAPSALILKPAPVKPAPTLTQAQQQALAIAQSPDLMGTLSDSQKIQLLLDINTAQEAKIDHLDQSLHEFRMWVQNRFYLAAISGALGGAGIGYGGTKALAAAGAFMGWGW